MQLDTKVAVLLAVVVSVAVTAGITYMIYPQAPQASDPEPATDGHAAELFGGTNEIRRISSLEELRDVLESSGDEAGRGEVFFSAEMARGAIMAQSAAMVGDADVSFKGMDYSSTNVQVKNVDEPDYLKNDAKYVYIAYENTLSIIDAYPAESAGLILRATLDIESRYIHNMFLNGDRLVIFYAGDSQEEIIPLYDYVPRRTYNPVTHVLIMDVADKASPEIVNDYSIDGYFKDARMIGNHTYFVTGTYVDYSSPRIPAIFEDSVRVATSEAFYFDNEEEFSEFNTLTAIDIFGGITASKTFLMGYTGTFYVSEDNFYLTYQKGVSFGHHEEVLQERFFEIILPLLPGGIQDEIKSIQDGPAPDPVKWNDISEVMQEAYSQMDEESKQELFGAIGDALDEYDARTRTGETVIHRVSIDAGQIEYAAGGSVPGRLLNQFSMDQSGDRLRVATTTQYYTPSHGLVRANAVYILDSQMEVVGGLDRIAPDESIFSSRFMQDRLYLVTFRQVDPFFVIDLSGDVPKILGELKIPGFSNYLHPFDDEHVIGIGRDTKVDDNGRVQQLGVKIALFNVADVSNPTVADDLVIGGAGTQSEALYNHKAFLFDGTRGVMVIPVVTDTAMPGVADPSREGYWNGFHVFDVDRSGFDPRGIVIHGEGDRYIHAGDPRAFYIDDVLYTVYDTSLKMSDFGSLEEINSIEFANTGRLLLDLVRP